MRKSEVMVKDVKFNGDELIAAQDVNKQIWVGVTWVMRALGFNDDKAKHEKKKIKEDRVLSESIEYVNFGSYSNGHEVMCIMLQRLPLWAAKISISPSMRKAQPEIAEKLYRYQKDAADVLSKAFLPDTEEPAMTTEPARQTECANISVNMPDYSETLNSLQHQMNQMTEVLTNELKDVNKNLVKLLNARFTDNDYPEDRREDAHPQEKAEIADQTEFSLWRKSLENRVIRCLKYNVYDSCRTLFEDIRHQIGCDHINMLDVYEDVALRSQFEKMLDRVIYNESVRDRFCQMDKAVSDVYSRKAGKITQVWVWHTAYMHMPDVDWKQESVEFYGIYDRYPVNKKELVAYSDDLFSKFIDAVESM